MTRKDSEKDADRPHYYSQFWLDVAAGRKTIGGPRDDEELLDDEPITPITSTAPTSPIASRRASRNGQEHSSAFDGQSDVHDLYEAQDELPAARSTVEPMAVHDEVGEPEMEQEPDVSDLIGNDTNDLDLQETAVEDADIPDVDFDTLDEEDEDEDFYDEEEEEDDDWSGGRGRKKSKPSRQAKPAPKRPQRRDSRRGNY